MIHPLADVKTKCIGANTYVWQFAVILEGAVIGENCNINCHTFIEGDVVIGNKVTIKSGVYLWNGVRIHDDAFIGPNVVFTNDLRPRSKKTFKQESIIVNKGASIGANTTILSGVTIGEYAMTGIGSVVTKDLPPYSLSYGNPAIVRGWVDENGEKLQKKEDKLWESQAGVKFKENDWGIEKINL
jgi:acetyltransferase-like isoleucine patch superfamily enzyme